MRDISFEKCIIRNFITKCHLDVIVTVPEKDSIKQDILLTIIKRNGKRVSPITKQEVCFADMEDTQRIEECLRELKENQEWFEADKEYKTFWVTDMDKAKEQFKSLRDNLYF